MSQRAGRQTGREAYAPEGLITDGPDVIDSRVGLINFRWCTDSDLEK